MEEKPDNYYEGVLQLRNASKEVVSFVRKQVEKSNVLITKEVKAGNGFDFYITSQRFLRVLGKKLKNNFCGELKMSRKLFTRNRQTCKNVYRVNVLFRCFNIRVGDVKEIKGEKVKIMALGNKITVKNLATGKKSSLGWELFK